VAVRAWTLGIVFQAIFVKLWRASARDTLRIYAIFQYFRPGGSTFSNAPVARPFLEAVTAARLARSGAPDTVELRGPRALDVLDLALTALRIFWASLAANVARGLRASKAQV